MWSCLFFSQLKPQAFAVCLKNRRIWYKVRVTYLWGFCISLPFQKSGRFGVFLATRRVERSLLFTGLLVISYYKGWRTSVLPPHQRTAKSKVNKEMVFINSVLSKVVCRSAGIAVRFPWAGRVSRTYPFLPCTYYEMITIIVLTQGRVVSADYLQARCIYWSILCLVSSPWTVAVSQLPAKSLPVQVMKTSAYPG